MNRLRRVAVASALTLLGALTWAGAAAAAPHSSCTGVDQISDASGDGHHDGTDVIRGWFYEDATGTHAAMTMFSNVWQPQHEDEPGSSYAMVFTVNGVAQYVRARAPLPAGAALVYDYGAFTPSADPTVAFASQGATTGSATTGLTGGVTIDVPAALAAPGTRLAAPFVVTSDGAHFVDHGPGGAAYNDTARGADYTIGGCNPSTSTTTTSVSLQVRRSITGAQVVPVIVQVQPVRAGVPVQLTRTAYRSTKVGRGITNAAGQLVARIPVSEVTRFSAVAEGVASQTRTVDVNAKFAAANVTRIGKVGARIRARLTPGLAGTILVLPTDDVRAVARIKVTGANVVANVRKLAAGRYQLVYVPAAGRAERVTSKVLRIR